MTRLDSLKRHTTVVADTGDTEAITVTSCAKGYRPVNSSIR
jgi:hypothetical protein